MRRDTCGWVALSCAALGLTLTKDLAAAEPEPTREVEDAPYSAPLEAAPATDYRVGADTTVIYVTVTPPGYGLLVAGTVLTTVGWLATVIGGAVVIADRSEYTYDVAEGVLMTVPFLGPFAAIGMEAASENVDTIGMASLGIAGAFELTGLVLLIVGGEKNRAAQRGMANTPTPELSTTVVPACSGAELGATFGMLF